MNKLETINSIAVIGLGYVGLPLALQAEAKGFNVIGIDLDEKKLAKLEKRQPVIDDEIANQRLKSSNITITNKFEVLKGIDAVIICVPTPVDENKVPNLSPVKGAVTSVIAHMKPNSLLVVESTINPGVCDEIVIPLIESKSKFKVGKDIHIAHCPERINPGDLNWNVGNINRVLGASDEHGLSLALNMYQRLIDAQIKPMGNLKEAEACKVVENSFRDINIVFVNELAMSFHVLGINVENVIDGAATKPFAFMPHHPGTGVGGHCIPVDPYYLIEYAHHYGFEHDFLKHARQVNEGMPSFTVGLLAESLNELGKSIKGTKVALLGLSYKSNVGDDRESPAYVLKQLLENADANLVIYDPYIKKGSTVHDLEAALEHAEAIVIATGHSEFKDGLSPDMLKNYNVKVVIDGRNLLKDLKLKFEASEILYQGIGV